MKGAPRPASPVLSRLLLGTWRLDRWGLDAAALADHLRACADLGVTTIDTADVYGGYECQDRLGEALARDRGLRDRLQIVTKTGIRIPSHVPSQLAVRVKHYSTTHAYITGQVDKSLAALGTDHVDVLLIHRPDPLMDADQVAEAFVDLQRAGKVLAFGVSNFAPSQVELVQSRLAFPLVANQIELSLAHLAPLWDGTLDQCQRLRMTPMAWSPLGGGRLVAETDGALPERLRDVAAELGGATPDQVALAWLLRHPAHVHPVLGTGKLDRVKSAVAAQRITIDRQQWFRLLEAAQGREVP